MKIKFVFNYFGSLVMVDVALNFCVAGFLSPGGRVCHCVVRTIMIILNYVPLLPELC